MPPTSARFLLVMPFALGFEQQVSSPGWKLLGRVAILAHGRGIGLASLPCWLEAVVLLLEGHSPQLDPYVLHRFRDQLRNIESIRHKLGAWKGLLDCQIHIRGHSQRHFGDGVPRFVREFVKHLSNSAGLGALDHRHEGTLFPVGRLVREGSPEFAIRHSNLVKTQMGAEILWKEHPVFSVLVLPGRAAAQRVFVLLLELLGLQLVGSRNGGERDRLSLCLVLLKKLQTPALVKCRGNRVGWHASDTQPGRLASNSVVGRSDVCVFLAGGNP
jgi:hypothetical protein